MATTPVRFEFDCLKAPEKLKFTHSVPSLLINSSPQAPQTDPEYRSTFVSAVEPIFHEHYELCRSLSSPTCQACNKASTKVLLTPMSWLHLMQDPFVNVWVSAVCAQEICEGKVRMDIQDTMALMSSQGGGVEEEGEVESIMEVLPCKVCGKAVDTSKCKQCMVVAYCGKEHQREDWKDHKKICKLLKR